MLKQILRDLPEMLEDQTRTGTYGSWYNYYICGVAGEHQAPEELEEHRRLGDLAYELQELRASTPPRERCDL